MWDPDNQLMRKRNFYMLLQANKSIPCNKQIRTQNMYQKFNYEKLHISAKTTEIKLLKFYQLMIYK